MAPVCVFDTDGIVCFFVQRMFLEVRGCLGEEELRNSGRGTEMPLLLPFYPFRSGSQGWLFSKLKDLKGNFFGKRVNVLTSLPVSMICSRLATRGTTVSRVGGPAWPPGAESGPRGPSDI